MSVVDEDALRSLLEEVVEKTVKKVLRSAPPEVGGGDKWVRTVELARNHSLAQSTIRQWIRAGKVEAKLFGGAMRVSLASFERFISMPHGDTQKALSPEQLADRDEVREHRDRREKKG